MGRGSAFVAGLMFGMGLLSAANGKYGWAIGDFLFAALNAVFAVWPVKTFGQLPHNPHLSNNDHSVVTGTHAINEGE